MESGQRDVGGLLKCGHKRRRTAQGAGQSHRIYRALAEAVERVRAGEIINLSPLCGGMDPDIAWPYLKRIGEVVIPEAAGGGGGEK